MSNKLIELTDIVINDVMKDEIVLPSTYKEKFEKKAKELNIIIEDELELIESVIDKELSKANNVMQSTRQSVTKLEKFTANASDAIKNRDEKALEAISKEVESLKKDLQKINLSLYMDPLTKTYNKTWLSEQFLQNDSFVSDGVLSFVDINAFKNINETYGNVVADKILIYVANFLKQKFKASKIVRFGGDLFLILSQEGVGIIKKALQTYLQELKTKKLKAPNGDPIYVSYSYGAVEYQEDDIFRDAFEMAETLLEENKKSAHSS